MEIVYNVKMNSLEVLDACRTPFSQYFGCASVLVEDSKVSGQFVVCMGGITDNYNCSKDVWIFDVGKVEWRKSKCSLPFPVVYCSAVLDKKRKEIHVLGGKNDHKDDCKNHWVICVDTLF